jgi:hypothetical protein
MIETVLHRPRGSGKTTEMCKIAQRRGGVVITYSREMARSLRERFPGVEAFHWEDYVRYRRTVEGRRIRSSPVLVDEADTLLSLLLDGAQVLGVSMTQRTERERKLMGSGRPSYIIVDDLGVDDERVPVSRKRAFVENWSQHLKEDVIAGYIPDDLRPSGKTAKVAPWRRCPGKSLFPSLGAAPRKKTRTVKRRKR